MIFNWYSLSNQVNSNIWIGRVFSYHRFLLQKKINFLANDYGSGSFIIIGIAQLNSSNTNRIYDSDEENWIENRSKLLHETSQWRIRVMKLEQGSFFFSKIKCRKKIPKKRKKAASTISPPSLPKECVVFSYLFWPFVFDMAF